MNTDGGLTYSASAVSEVSESNEESIRPARDYVNTERDYINIEVVITPM